jgi:two-component system, NtrC family, response regulator HydG
MKTEEIMVVEDNEAMRLGIEETLKREDYKIAVFDNGIDALKYFKERPVQIAILDLKMEPLDGIEILKQMKEIFSTVEVLMISAHGTVDNAVIAMKLGAFDFLTKPFSPDELRLRIKKIEQKVQSIKKIENLIQQNQILSDELYSGYNEMVGNSPSIKKVFAVIDQVADKGSSILIQGESGTGKELVARAIHKKSKRAENPFIKINCGALNDNLLESELFGHEKGSFTGAIKQRKGRFELADKGTLFLDEIGDVSPSMQIKLLRVLQEGEFERVGGEKSITTDVRIIAATNKDFQKLISEGKFREDLFYRLSVIPITLPPLRERKEDIPVLTEHLLNKYALKYNLSPKRIEERGMKIFLDYSWKGNIRELENLIERLFVISPGELIEPEIISLHLSNIPVASNNAGNLPLEETLYNIEKNMLIQAMEKSGGVKNRAAKLLGINTSVLYYKLEKFGLL